MTRRYVTLKSFFEAFKGWREPGSLRVVSPLEKAKAAGFTALSTNRFLKMLEEARRIKKVYRGKRLEAAEVLNLNDVAQKKRGPKPSAKKIPKAASVAVPIAEKVGLGKKVVVVVDLDNMIIRPRDLTGEDVNPFDVCKAIIAYAEKLGEVARAEVFATLNTRKFDEVVHFCFDLGVSVNVVPPRPEAADVEMRNSLALSASHPEVGTVVVASNDRKAFFDVLRSIKDGGREVHLVTPGAAVSGIAGASTTCVSMFALIAQQKAAAAPDVRRRAPDIKNKFTFAALRIKESNGEFVPTNAGEEFVLACWKAIRPRIKDSEGRWMSFNPMAETTWRLIRHSWGERFDYKACRTALTALIGVEQIKRGERGLKGRTVAAHFVEE